MTRTILACLAAGAALAGCAVQSPQPRPQPDILVYTGLPKDPRYQVPEKYRQTARTVPGMPGVVHGPQARQPLPELISADDYPASALAQREQGRVAFTLDVRPDGRVQGCTITRSSGSAALDSATCALMVRRARFTPATGIDGEPVPGRIAGEIWWKLPDGSAAPPDRLTAARFQQEAQVIHERVQSDPAFGGFVLRWEPQPHALVMFTGDAEARLRRYTSDPRFRSQSVELTLAELERMKDWFGAELSRLGLDCFSIDGDEVHNAVTVGAPPQELAKVRAAIAAGKVRTPRKLRLKEEGCATFR